MSQFGDLKDFVDGLEEDFSKFYDKGNKAAGTRVRKAMQDLKKMPCTPTASSWLSSHATISPVSSTAMRPPASYPSTRCRRRACPNPRRFAR